MPAFEYRQAEEVHEVFARYGVRYLFIGKSGAILLGFPDTTQDAHLFVEKSPSKVATNRVKDRESLPRLRSFRQYWLAKHGC
jgi:hypothetical protein